LKGSSLGRRLDSVLFEEDNTGIPNSVLNSIYWTGQVPCNNTPFPLVSISLLTSRLETVLAVTVTLSSSLFPFRNYKKSTANLIHVI
jgi:hypothetical protein